MNSKDPLLSIVLAVLVVLGTVSTLFFYSGLKKETAKRMMAEQKTQSLVQEKSQVEKKAVELREELDKVQERSSALEKDLANVKKLVMTLENEIETKEEELSKLQQQADERVLELHRQLADKDRSNQEMNTMVASLKAELEKLKSSQSDQGNGGSGGVVQLDKIEVQSSGSAPAAAPLKGEVLSVNPEYGFVIVSLGSKDGLVVGAPLKIYRGSQSLGDARAERVFDVISAASIPGEQLKKMVKEGDQVYLTYF